MADPDTSAVAAAVRAEIEDLHVRFEDWFSGRAPRDGAWFEHHVASRFSRDLLLVFPGGTRVGRDALVTGVKEAHGCSPEFRIQIRDVTVRPLESERHVLAIYEEWQRNAVNSAPPDNGRVSSVVFEVRETDPLRLAWLHVHETWLPAQVIERDAFAF